MIDIENDELLTLKQAVRRVPGNPHVSTIFRWVATEKLESVKVGGRRFTSRAAIHTFVENCTGRKLQNKPTRRRNEQMADANRELERDGLI